MTKLAKYLKPYLGAIFMALILLFVQAMCDLNLPNYMSDIVDTGLSQGGITERVPSAIPESYYAQVMQGMTGMGKDVTTLTDSFTLVEAGDGQYKDKYPASVSENIYVQNEELPQETLDTLAKAFGESAYMGLEMSKGAAPEDAMKNIANLDPMVLEQMSTAFVNQMYTALGMDMGKIQQSYIWKIGAMMLLVTLIGTIASVLVGYIASRTAAGTSRNLRHDIFSKVESFSSAEFDKFSTASLITRTTNDVTQVQMLVIMGIRMIFYAPIMGIGGIVMAVEKGPSISWIIALAVILLIALIAGIFLVAMPKFKIIQKLIDRLNLVSRENLSGIMTVRAFGNQEFEKDRFDKANSDLTKTNLFVNRVMVFMMPAMMIIMNGATLLIVWVGADKIAAGSMQVGAMMAFMQYAMQIIMSFLMISMMFIMVPRAAVSGTRIAEVLQTKPSITDPKLPRHFNKDKSKGLVEFRNVSFRYNGAEEDVLHNLSFIAKPGETTAFIGSTGSGKSTLINLIPRFYDVTSGELLVGGVNIKEVTQHDLHEQIGYVSQKGVLHSGTIASNIRYGKQDATDAQVHKAAEVAQALDFINSPDVGFDSPISEGGTNVSGGQKQRISIARALIKKPPIYIFDDSFSALDFKTDAALRRALKGYTDDATVLIVAQRVSTIMNSEQIIVLNEGEIVGKGTHKELLASCPTYLEIASSQLSKEEL